MRKVLSVLAASFAVAPFAIAAPPPANPHLLQRPALTQTQIVFNYAGDLWTVDRKGGKATRLTAGVGIETAPVVSPDGSTIAFSGEYDGNTDVFTIPIAGGIPKRVTYHPSIDVPVAWTPDGKQIIFRSDRQATSRFAQLFEVAPTGGVAKLLPLPLAYQGQISADGKMIAYSPLAPAFGFNYTSYVSWGNYRGGRAGTVNITSLPDLTTTAIPHEKASDFSPVWFGNKVYFLSDRKGSVSLFSYDPATKAVTEALHNTGSDMHSLSAGPGGLVYDQLGEIYLFDPASGKSHMIEIDVTGDLPEVRERIENVSAEIEHAGISPTGIRAVFEAHGEILTVPVKHGPTRDLTNTPGAMERWPAWAPDGQSIAYFSDESGLYALHVASQNDDGPVKKFPLAAEAAYYFQPKWSPDSKKIAFYDNRLNLWMLDIVTGKLSHVGENNFFSGIDRDYAWSPDSRWLAYSRTEDNHLSCLYLYSTETGTSTVFTDKMADSGNPAFDRNGKYLYFTASTNQGGTAFGLDMTSDLLRTTRNLYALVLAADAPSPVAPESDDEKTLAEAKEHNKDMGDEPTTTPAKPAGQKPDEAAEAKASMPAVPTTKPTKIDLAGIETRVVALPLPSRRYTDLDSGKAGGFFFVEHSEGGGPGTLKRFSLESRKAETISDRVESYSLSANGEKVLLEQPHGGDGGTPNYSIVPATPAPAGGKPGGDSGVLNLADMQIRTDPAAEWRQMYHEVWRVERAYFYDPHFHGVDTVADEKKFEPYVRSIASRTDLNYIFQEMLGPFSVGHLRGNGGAIPEAKRVPGGLLGADYTIVNNQYCIAKLYDGGHWNPNMTGPLTQPGLNVHVGDCITAIGGKPLTAAEDIQRPLEGTAGHAVTLRLATGSAPARDITIIPIRSEASLRNVDWIESNQKKVDQLSGGKLAYVYLPDTGEGGFTNFNRYYFAQDNKQGAIIDERFNAGGQVADYIIEAMKRPLLSFWQPRYGAIDRTPTAAILGAKVMITNEFSGSGGDAMPYLFRQQKIGPLVGKRTWGGLVGIGGIPVLMDGGNVTSPSFGQFSPSGVWDVENKGVEPDFPVDQDPKAVSEGHDPQLEKAVALALEGLEKSPVPAPKRPPFPDYHNR
ncbi:S41 family peptidase [Granulicella tundricola]|uniref:Tricorn protease homolog n=1 Tax=Granulicella tundricola (strain ATCC BAA-1859 / DSM 23138 / MP5ACTX9) TaxID=1198114 RepID=E8WXR8_GRATM|nr:S41 family peptidase [Granulicella tundricola]ADW69763.1 peptidase S41 [Granulicella tundricola MP5ACTX9]